jgi:cytidine deaminase
MEIVAVAVVNHRGVPCSPCGACRQVLAEFGPQATVWYLGAKGIVQRHDAGIAGGWLQFVSK